MIDVKYLKKFKVPSEKEFLTTPETEDDHLLKHMEKRNEPAKPKPKR